MKIHKAYVFRLYPTNLQEDLFVRTAGCCRAVYNAALEQRRTWGRCHRITYVKQAAELKACKNAFPWLKEAPHHCLQQALRDLDAAYQRFFSGQNGYPKPRLRRHGERFRFPDPAQFKFRDDAVRLPKAGWVRWVRHRPMEGNAKSVTVRREGSWWVASVLCEVEVAEPWHGSNRAVGIDLGVSRPIALSTGDSLSVARMTTKHQRRLRVLQQAVARKKRGSNNRLKAVRRLAAYQAHQARRRRHRLHEATAALTDAFSFIAIEDLKVRNMTASAKGTTEVPGKNVKSKAGLNRSMLDVSMAEFRRQIEYKALWKGGTINAVRPHHTSQICSSCGFTHQSNRENQATFRCRQCGHTENADTNAARNILARAHELPTGGRPGIACEVNRFSAQQQETVGAIL